MSCPPQIKVHKWKVTLKYVCVVGFWFGGRATDADGTRMRIRMDFRMGVGVGVDAGALDANNEC